MIKAQLCFWWLNVNSSDKWQGRYTLPPRAPQRHVWIQKHISKIVRADFDHSVALWLHTNRAESHLDSFLQVEREQEREREMLLGGTQVMIFYLLTLYLGMVYVKGEGLKRLMQIYQHTIVVDLGFKDKTLYIYMDANNHVTTIDACLLCI